MIKYIFREGEPVRLKSGKLADPQVIGEELDRIRVSAGGQLEPQAVVNAARNKKNPLHPFLEWDDSRAAEAFRLDQARAIVRLVRVVDEETEEGSARAFISLAGVGGISYRSVQEVKTSRDLAEAVLAAADRDLAAFERRYRELREICAIVVEAREAIKRRRARKVDNRSAA